MAAPKRAAYTASKHGVVGLTRAMALELGEKNIRVNAVAPGVVRTPLTERYFQDPDYMQAIRDIHALGRWAEPEEIAKAILFLAGGGERLHHRRRPDGGWRLDHRQEDVRRRSGRGCARESRRVAESVTAAPDRARPVLR